MFRDEGKILDNKKVDDFITTLQVKYLTFLYSDSQDSKEIEGLLCKNTHYAAHFMHDANFADRFAALASTLINDNRLHSIDVDFFRGLLTDEDASVDPHAYFRQKINLHPKRRSNPIGFV
jgi:hypothetical protein